MELDLLVCEPVASRQKDAAVWSVPSRAHVNCLLTTVDAVMQLMLGRGACVQHVTCCFAELATAVVFYHLFYMCM